ncbi:MAG: ATP-binding protein [Candidatus Moraniibacteriota bacterium]
MKTNLYSRELLKEINPFIKRKEAIIIRGTRRVGKTSLLKLLAKELLRQGIKQENIYFFDLENIGIREDFNNDPKNILKYIENNRSKQYIFIDEIQYLDHPSNFIKLLVDHHPNLKIFVTGSSSLDIKKKIQDSLVGRAFYFHLYPLDFFEFLRFKKVKYPKEPTANQSKRLSSLLEEYLLFGAMPEVVLERNLGVKKEILANYTNLYVAKDIRNLTEIENISAFNNLIKILAGQTGNLLDKTEISNTLNTAFNTTNRYLDILQYTYIALLLKPYFANLRAKLTKTPKIYFYDLGLRNSLLNDFNPVDFRVDRGALFENFILLQLLRKFKQQDIFFYRNNVGNEIDFIIDKNKTALEVKFKKMKDGRVFRVFDTFSKFDNYVLNLTLNKQAANYRFIDWWHFLNSLMGDKG